MEGGAMDAGGAMGAGADTTALACAASASRAGRVAVFSVTGSAPTATATPDVGAAM
jgi:hypothetical protein